jgi:hypothetical protein
MKTLPFMDNVVLQPLDENMQKIIRFPISKNFGMWGENCHQTSP